MLYLDPHTTQQTVHIPGPAHKHASFPDVSYHCSQADRILISDLDPSLSIVRATATQPVHNDSLVPSMENGNEAIVPSMETGNEAIVIVVWRLGMKL